MTHAGSRGRHGHAGSKPAGRHGCLGARALVPPGRLLAGASRKEGVGAGGLIARPPPLGGQKALGGGAVPLAARVLFVSVRHRYGPVHKELAIHRLDRRIWAHGRGWGRVERMGVGGGGGCEPQRQAPAATAPGGPLCGVSHTPLATLPPSGSPDASKQSKLTNPKPFERPVSGSRITFGAFTTTPNAEKVSNSS